jgi:hypothetical protein
MKLGEIVVKLGGKTVTKSNYSLEREKITKPDFDLVSLVLSHWYLPDESSAIGMQTHASKMQRIEIRPDVKVVHPFMAF